MRPVTSYTTRSRIYSWRFTADFNWWPDTWGMRWGLILSGVNFVPQGNNLSNGIREKTKEGVRGKLQIVPGRLGRLSKNACILSDRSTVFRSARVPKCCVGSCRFSLSLPAEFQSVLSKELPSRSVSQSCKVLCRIVSQVVLSSRVLWCIIAC